MIRSSASSTCWPRLSSIFSNPLETTKSPILLAFEQRAHDDPRTLGSLFYACSEEQKDLSLAEALHRLLSLALTKAREAGIIAEDAVLTLIDAVMSIAIDMLQSGKRLLLVNNELAAS